MKRNICHDQHWTSQNVLKFFLEFCKRGAEQADDFDELFFRPRICGCIHDFMTQFLLLIGFFFELAVLHNHNLNHPLQID